MGLGSEIWDRKKTYPGSGSRGQKGTGSRTPDPDQQHCLHIFFTKELTPFILCVSLIAERARLAEELTPFILCVSLIAERTRLAASVSLPAYMVVSEQSLLQLAEMRPTSPASLARIQVGEQLLWSRFREDRLNPFYFRPRIHKKKIF